MRQTERCNPSPSCCVCRFLATIMLYYILRFVVVPLLEFREDAEYAVLLFSEYHVIVKVYHLSFRSTEYRKFIYIFCGDMKKVLS